MPLTWDGDVLERFFGVELYSGDGGGDFFRQFDYRGKQLKYSLLLNVTKEIAMFSGDHDYPFGGDSMYEFCIPCDRITCKPDGYHPDQTGLGFWYGDPGAKENMTMMFLKRPDGDLKVWPGCVWPTRHAYFQLYGPENGRRRFDPPIQ